jgi:predicted TIM-barrel fold metal-dependent hydrolase
VASADQQGFAEAQTHDVFAHFVDEEWLATTREEAIDPERPIVDPHHHIWAPPKPLYGVEQLLSDLNGGHNVRATVHLEAYEGWYEDGPEHLRAAGETQHVATLGERFSAPGGVEIAAGIVGHADLTAGAKTAELLDRHIELGQGRFKGVRANLNWDEDVDVAGIPMVKDLSDSPRFREGFALLAPRGLVVDVFAYYTNLPVVADLVKAFPETPVVLNHCGGPLGRPPYTDRPQETFDQWRRNIEMMARFPNVHMKIGGLTNPFFGPLIPAGLREQPTAPTSQRLAELMRPYVEASIDAYGPQRCMFESNFPADKPYCDYVVLWNAFKRLASGYSESEQDDLFAGTAARFYGITL